MKLSYLWSLLVKDPLIILCTMLMATVSVLVSFLDRDGRITDGIARTWARMLVFLAGIRLRVHGLHHIEGERYIFAGNHLSLMDTPVVLTSVPVRFLFLVNHRYVALPFLGTHLRRTGHFSIDQEDIKGALKVMTEAGRVMLRRNLSILVFPEGRRARGESLDEFKEGAAYMAIKTGIPVIPFAIRGTREVLPIGSLHVKGGPVEIVFGAPISTDGYTLKDRARFNQTLRDTVEALARDLDGEPRGVESGVS